jgi:hypothetical protein
LPRLRRRHIQQPVSGSSTFHRSLSNLSRSPQGRIDGVLQMLPRLAVFGYLWLDLVHKVRWYVSHTLRFRRRPHSRRLLTANQSPCAGSSTCSTGNLPQTSTCEETNNGLCRAYRLTSRRVPSHRVLDSSHHSQRTQFSTKQEASL